MIENGVTAPRQGRKVSQAVGQASPNFLSRFGSRKQLMSGDSRDSRRQLQVRSRSAPIK